MHLLSISLIFSHFAIFFCLSLFRQPKGGFSAFWGAYLDSDQVLLVFIVTQLWTWLQPVCGTSTDTFFSLTPQTIPWRAHTVSLVMTFCGDPVSLLLKPVKISVSGKKKELINLFADFKIMCLNSNWRPWCSHHWYYEWAVSYRIMSRANWKMKTKCTTCKTHTHTHTMQQWLWQRFPTSIRTGPENWQTGRFDSEVFEHASKTNRQTYGLSRYGLIQQNASLKEL